MGCVCGEVGMHVYMCIVDCRGKKRKFDSMKQDLKPLMSSLIWVLGTKLRSSESGK